MELGRDRELEDLTVSFLVLTLLFADFDVRAIPYVLLAVLTAFVFHELAHRFMARGYGYRAFYRRWNTGILLALGLGVTTKLLTGTTWIFAALGAVQIYAPYAIDEREYFGKIALAGPAVNIAVGAAAMVLLYMVPAFGPAWYALWLTARINLWLAFFNLLPFPPLDGSKVAR